ncbi:IS256 family transposase [Patescibacteria group bacterium]|nr:IS256 family transposase [Patescibacteria group bacterium]MBU1931100.1 IS256 family transposase [Patescibacteria group bacterium]
MSNAAQRNYSKINKLPIFENNQQLIKFLESSFTESLKQLIRLTVKTMIKTEMNEFRKETEGFIDKLYFNGHYPRNMISSMGKVKGINVPRFRQKPDGWQPKTLNIFTAEQEKFMRLIEQMHLLGISQRKIRQLAKTCLGITISANRVGKIYKQLAVCEEANINDQMLDDNFKHLLADGLWSKVKGYGWENNKGVLLCVLGIRPDGKRKIIGFSVERSESYQNWYKLLSSIKQRGLRGKNLQLAITDDTEGLHGAIKQLFPNTPVQNCIVHKMRNVIGKARHKHKAAIGEDIKVVFNQENKQAAIKEAKSFCKKWYLKEPNVINSFRHNLEPCFTYLQFPKEQWSKIRSTNILEREFREIRRRIKVFDSSFNNVESKKRYANSIINYLNQNYPSAQGSFTQ